jgi:DNA-binding MarR family transcriptional regulator
MITSGGMTKRLDRLEKAGLVERCPDPTDRRGVLIRITRQGRATIDSTLDTLLDAEREAVVGALPDIADRDRLVGLLRELLLAFERFDEVSSDEA